jgi:hypothetical protein
MEQFARSAGGVALTLAAVTVMLGATVLLTCIDVARRRLLSLTWHDQPVLLSRDTRTVWCTVLVLVTVSATALLNLPAPDIVYQAF